MRTYNELKALIEKRGVHTVFGEPGESDWFIEQNPHELATFLVEMQALNVTSVLEIGTGWRAGLARFLSEDLGWRVVSLDRNMPVSPAPLVEFYLGRSEILRPLFDGWQFDLVIIDADHSYEAIRRDHEMYAPLATKVIMFHDIAGLRDCEGAKKYWAELVLVRLDENLNSHSIVDNDEEKRGGIGWYEIGETYITVPEPIAVETDLDDAVFEAVVIEDEPTYEEMTRPVEKPKRKRKPKA